jgi:tetratricopeptide (TPR) repeat protein
VPLAYGAAWGINSLLPSWGYSYGYSYENPYYTESATSIYDYSQPVAMATYNVQAPGETAGAQQPLAQPQPAAGQPVTGPTAGPTHAPQEPPEQTAAYQLFDQAREAFKKGDYASALRADEQAIRKFPNDPVLHEFAALCLFAQGDYKRAATVLNSLLAAAPGMDWTTMMSLYPNSDTYTTQLRTLEARCRERPDDPAAAFVLGYHYLVIGQNGAAANAMKRVVAKQPGDVVAKQILDALTAKPPEQPAAAAQTTAGPQTDLVGRWRAERDGAIFELTVDEKSQFTWKATPKGKAPITVNGTVTAGGDMLILKSKDQGSMVGVVTPGGPDQFQFVSTGGPPNDKGLSFLRAKEAG